MYLGFSPRKFLSAFNPKSVVLGSARPDLRLLITTAFCVQPTYFVNMGYDNWRDTREMYFPNNSITAVEIKLSDPPETT